jgi:hypothetical protein
VSVQTPEAEAIHTVIHCPRCGADHADGDGCPSCGLLSASVPCAPGSATSTTRFRCVICGVPVCGGEPSGTDAALCELHEDIPVIQGWAQVYTTSDEIEAGLISENLRADGLDSQLYTQKDDNFPVDLGELSIIRVLVPSFDYERGIEIIRSYMNQSGEVGFACANCGEVYEPGAEVCTNCGASLIGEAE